MSRITRRTIIPVNQITPLTYRDGVTYIQLLTELSDYIKTILHPSLQHTVDQLVADVETQMDTHHDQYVDGVQEFQRIHDAFMSDVNAHLIALNDGAVSDLVEDDTSLLGQVLREIFPDREEFTELSESLTYRTDKLISDTTTTVEHLTTTITDQQQTFESSITDQLDHRIQTIHDDTQQAVAQTFNNTEQLDFVDMLQGLTVMDHVQVRKTGNGERGAFQVSRVGPGRPGYHLTWAMTSGNSATSDDYHRVHTIRVGYVGSGTPNNQGWYDDVDQQFDLVGSTVHEFALKFRPANRPDLDTVWAPQHSGIPTCFEASAPILDGPTERLLIDTEPLNTRWGVGPHPVVLKQHVYARHPDTGNRNLLEIRTAHKFNPDGTTELTGMWRALEDVYISTGYTGMYAGYPEYVNKILTSKGNSYPVTDNEYGTGIYRMEDEGDTVKAYAMRHGNARNFVSAIRYDHTTETLRRGQFGKPSSPALIDYRSADLVKIYNSQFNNTNIPAGYVHRFKVTYMHTYGAGLNQIIDG